MLEVKGYMTEEPLDSLLADIRGCRICADDLPLGPNPVIRASGHARILIVGQAPGRKVHETSIPFNDPSGDRLRDWMGIDRGIFYDESRINIVPMGFCFPGTGKSGDLPPRPECAITWRDRLMAEMGKVELTLIIGQYATNWHLGKNRKKTLTETVKNWRDYWPSAIVLPHPSPRNNIWLKRNDWFEEDALPHLKKRVQELLSDRIEN